MSECTLILERLTERREKMNLTKQQAAQVLGMTQPTYLRYENGDRVPSLHVLKTIAEGLGTSVNYLTGKTDDPSPDFFVIKKENDEELFTLIERFKSDEAFKKRMLAYYAKLGK